MDGFIKTMGRGATPLDRVIGVLRRLAYCFRKPRDDTL
jgi:hypothetical protein